MSDLYRPIEDILGECIDMVERGELTIEQAVADYPEHEVELRELLDMMAFFQEAPEVAVSAEKRTSNLQDILSQLQSGAKQNWWQKIWQSRNEPLFGPRMGWVFAIAIMLLLGMGGLGRAADGAVPGDMLYELDRGVETVRMGFARSEQSRLNLLLDYAEERLFEASSLSDQATINATLQAYDMTMLTAVETALSAETATGGFDTVTQSHDQLLTDISDNHPVAASIALEYGIDEAQITAWRDAGYGFGEINLALATAAETEQAADVLLTEKESGKAWSEILEQEREREKAEAEVTREAEKQSAESTREADKDTAEQTREADKNEAEATRKAEQQQREQERKQEEQTREAYKEAAEQTREAEKSDE